MNELKVFQHSEFGELGIITIDGKEYFPATACAKILGYASPKDAITAHCKGAVKHRLLTNGGNQTVKYIPEGDLYRLIIRSKLPAAERFERWVFDEVLPEIRKQGAYGGKIPMEQVTQIIQMTATAMMTEFIKQVAPVLIRKDDPERDHAETEIIRSTTIVTEVKRKRIKPRLGKIEQLPEELRTQVDQLLEENATYRGISQFLGDLGHNVSCQAVHNYYKKFFTKDDVQ